MSSSSSKASKNASAHSKTNSRVPAPPLPKPQARALQSIKEELKKSHQAEGKSLGPKGIAFGAKAEYYGLLSPQSRGWLASLIDPFAGLKSARSGSSYAHSPSIPVLPPAKARRYCCFARGTFNTVPSVGVFDPTHSAYTVDAAGGSPYDSNLGWIALSPKLFGLQTSTSLHEVPSVLSAPPDPAQTVESFSQNAIFNQPPLLFTKGTASGGLGTPVSPQFLGTYSAVPGLVGPETGAPNVFYSGFSFTEMSGEGSPGSYFAGVNKTNCVKPGYSNSDVNWWEVLPKSNPQNVQSQMISLAEVGTEPGITQLQVAEQQFDVTETMGGARYRLVSVGIRVRYMGTEINRGGQIVGLRSPTGDTLVQGTYGGVGIQDTIIVEADEENPSQVFRSGYYDIPPFYSSPTYYDPGILKLTNFPNPASNGYFGPYPFTGMTFERLLSFDECTTSEVDRGWHNLVYLPVDASSLQFQHLYDGATFRSDSSTTGQVGLRIGGNTEQIGDPIGHPSCLMDNDWGYSMLIMVRGPDNTTVANFEFEVVGHYEIVGEDIRGRVPSAPPDPSGVAAILSAPPDGLQSHTNPIQAHVSVVQSSSNQSFVHPSVRQAAHNPPGGVLKAISSVEKFVNSASDAVNTASSVADEVMEYIGAFASLL